MKKFLFILLIFNLAFSFWLYSLNSHDTYFNYLYNLSYSLNFLLAGITCFRYAKINPLHYQIYFSLGLGSLSYFFAQVIWFAYNYFLLKDTPYPGLADVFFLAFYLFMALGGILIMNRAINIKFHFAQLLEIALVTGVLFLIINDFIQSSAPQISVPLLPKILNYTYPLLDALLVSLSLAAIRSKLGSLQPILLYFILAFVTLAFADTIFTHQTSLGTYWNGNYVDAMFSLSSFLFAMGVLNLPKIVNPHN